MRENMKPDAFLAIPLASLAPITNIARPNKTEYMERQQIIIIDVILEKLYFVLNSISCFQIISNPELELY